MEEGIHGAIELPATPKGRKKPAAERDVSFKNDAMAL